MEDPLKFFISQIESNDLSTKVNTIHRIKIIITLIGIESSKKNLLPIIENIIKKEDDEILFALAEVLYDISSFFQTKALHYLEMLLESEETVIREKASESVIKIVKKMNQNEIMNDIIPMINRLIKEDKKFMSKISAINVIIGVYEIIPQDLKINFKQIIQKLFNEDMSMVKKSLAGKIGDFCEVLSREEIISDIIPFFKKLSMDDQDQIKILTIISLAKIGNQLSIEESRNNIIPIIISFSSEKNWRIKIALSQNYYKFAQTLGIEITESSLIPIYSSLLRDTENEVRIEAVRGLKKFIKEIPNQKLNILIPYIQTLSEDSNNLVRTGVCEILSVIIKNISPEIIKTKLKLCIKDLFNDKDLEVNLEIIKILSPLAKTLKNDFISFWNLINKDNIINHMNWRVRNNFFLQIIRLSKIFINSLDIFNQHFYLYISKLSEDKAEIVRNNYCTLIKELGTKLLNDQKILKNILNDVNKLTNENKNYKFKITGIKLIIQLLIFLKGDLKEKNIEILNRLLADNVKNVRYTVLKILKDKWSELPENYKLKSTINLIKNISTNEVDEETKYEADLFLNNCE